MRRTGNISFAEERSEEGKNPLDTTFGPYSRRAQELRSAAQGGILEASESALTHLRLSTVSKLAQIAERYSDCLKYFPSGSRLLLSASGDPGSYCESGHLSACCELKFPTANGSMKRSGPEEFYRSGQGDTIEAAFEVFLFKMKGEELNGGGR